MNTVVHYSNYILIQAVYTKRPRAPSVNEIPILKSGWGAHYICHLHVWQDYMHIKDINTHHQLMYGVTNMHVTGLRAYTHTHSVTQ